MSNIEKKKKIVEEAVAKFKESIGIIITDYQGLTVEQINNLRRSLEKVGAKYKVLKNTLSKRMLDELNINGNLKGFFTGVTGIVFCTDYVSAIKVLAKFSKENENLKIKGGYIENKVYSVDDIVEISKLSSKEELVAQLVFLLNQPIQRLVNALSGPTRNLVYVLSSIKDKKQ